MASNVTTAVDAALETRVAAGERLTEAELQALAAVRDPLVLGALADEARRRRHGRVTTFGRVACVSVGAPMEDDSAAATEVRIVGEPASLAAAAAAVTSLRTPAGPRLLSGFSLAWVAEQAAHEGSSVGEACASLKAAGLDALADAPIDRLADPVALVREAREGGLAVRRLTLQAPAGEARVALLLRVRQVQDTLGGIEAYAPLPVEVPVTTPTTGYDDVRMVALARLALDAVPHIQIDWRQYGPKLAQVAIAFGADDLDGISPAGEGDEGRRRAPLEDVRRNITAAGCEPAERDGCFARVAG